MKRKLPIIPIICIVLLILLVAPDSLHQLETHGNVACDLSLEGTVSGQPPMGDWVVSNQTTLVGESLDIWAHVYITAGGNLTLVGCDVTMHSQKDWWTDPGVCCILVAEGGYLTLDNTHIHAGTSHKWYISADGGSGVDIQGCVFEGNYPNPTDDTSLNSVLCLGGWPTYMPLEYAVVKDNTIDGLEEAGIFIQSNNAEVSGNSITNVYNYGIEVMESPDANITHNTITNIGTVNDSGLMTGGTGIMLMDCENVAVSHNTVVSPATRGFGWRVDTSCDAPHCTGLREFDGNTVDGQAIFFQQDKSNILVGPGVKEVILHDCENITIDGFSGVSVSITSSNRVTIRNSEVTKCSIQTAFCSDVLIESNILQDTYLEDTVSVLWCSNVIVKNNTVNRTRAAASGIYTRWSSNIALESNSVSDAREWGITIMDDESVVASGNRVYNSGTAGIVSWRNSGVELKDNEIHNSKLSWWSLSDGGPYTGYCGIDVTECLGIIVSGNVVENSFLDGIWIDSSDNADIARNTVRNTGGRGIFVINSNRPSLEDNHIVNATWMGLGIYQCENSSISDIVLEDIKGCSVYWQNKFVFARISSFNNITLAGRAIALYQDQDSLAVNTDDIAGAILINCSHSRVEGLQGNFIGISHSNDVIVRSCTLSGAGVGFAYCTNSTVACCAIESTPFSNLTVYRGYISFGIVGISLYSCDNALVANNHLNDTERGAIDVFHSIPARIIGNEITDSGNDAIHLWQTREGTVTGNIVNNTWGHSISLESTSKLLLYLNYFGYSGNSSVGMTGASSQIKWDNGTYGNFYSEYQGVDQDSNGIGDTPYVIDEQNIDHYPLLDATPIDTHVRQLFSMAPQIRNVTVGPSPLVANTIAIFNATVTAEYSVTMVLLSYSLDNGATWTNKTMVTSGGVWTAVLTDLPAGTILYRVYAMDSLGNWAVSEQMETSVSVIDLLTLAAIVGFTLIAMLGLVVFFKRRTT